jgi:acyl-CoA thioesterase FadM
LKILNLYIQNLHFSIGFCVSRDIDIVLTHMNNARYLREVDLARIDFYIRTGLYDVVRSLNGHIWLGACNIRFRKFIRIFSRFKLQTKVVYWDEENIYLEHKFVGRDGFVHAVMLSQQRVVNCSAEDVMDILLKRGKAILTKPELSTEVKKFI